MKIVRRGDRFPMKRGVPFLLDLFGTTVPAVYTKRHRQCARCPIYEVIRTRMCIGACCTEWVCGCVSEDYHVVCLEEVVE